MDIEVLTQKAKELANVALSHYFDTVMYERYRQNYTSEIVQYCETYEQDTSIKGDNRQLLKHMKSIMEEKGNRFDCRVHFDITALNHLILYSTFRLTLPRLPPGDSRFCDHRLLVQVLRGLHERWVRACPALPCISLTPTGANLP